MSESSAVFMCCRKTKKVQTIVFLTRRRCEKKLSTFWKFTLLGLHYTSFRPTDPPAQDVRTQNLNTSVSALTQVTASGDLAQTNKIKVFISFLV